MLSAEKSLIMDINLEKNDGTTISSLFQQIIFDMKNSSPIWEDFVAKATKLHACLRAAIQAIAAYLEAFQKIADAATNSRGASKEIGTALTRVCLRHKAVETRMKTFTTAIMDSLVIPLQEKLEDWKRQVAVLDKDHAKEYKRCRTELKKRSSDTLRLQKKAKKGQIDNLQSLVDSSMQDVNQRRAELEDVERKSLRAAMIEERTRFCSFVNMLQPVVRGECEVMQELGHLQEAMDTIERVTREPQVLPQASEELILDTKAMINLYPDSPGGSSSQICSNSLGSRKSSVCSISSMNSSGSSGSPGHQFQRSLSQYSPAIRLKPGESSDSGFCSSPALTSQVSTSTSQTCPVSTWPPHNQDPVPAADRPHTISSAYEKGHQRPALTVYTFQNPEIINECQKSPANILCRPPLPVRCSSLERPLSATGVRNANGARQCPSPIPVHVTKEHPQPPQPTYVNMTELASMAASKITNQQQQQQQQQQQISQVVQQHSQTMPSIQQFQHHQHSQPQYQQLIQVNPNSPVLSSTSSLISPDSASATNPITSSISSPDGVSSSACSSQTPQNVSPDADAITPIGGTDSDGGGFLTPIILSPKNHTAIITGSDGTDYHTVAPKKTDIISSGSVLAKTSLFEKLEQQQQQTGGNASLTATPTNQAKTPVESIYAGANNVAAKKTVAQQQEEIYKSSGDSETDQLNKQTIEELNNLIGELDLFQKEQETAMLMEEEKQKTKQKLLLQQQHHRSNNNNNSPFMSIRKSPANFSDKISISSSNFESPNNSLTSSTNANCSTGGHYTFNYSDTELTKYVNDNESYDLSNTGFENPSFIHMNDQEIVVIHQNDYPTESENIYNQNMSEVVVLRCNKDDSTTNLVVVDTDANYLSDSSSVGGGSVSGGVGLASTQRFSSFKANGDSSSQLSVHSSGYGGSYSANSSPVMSNGGHSVDFKSILDERLRNKPAITPRPASLSGVSRIARRASINTVKPPPPVRRSSSVTPSHNLGAHSPSLQHQINAVSSESLPPPPPYLLDTTTANSLSPSNVAGTIKALNEIRHTPASPGVLRKAQQIQQYYNQQQIQQQYNHPTPKYDAATSLIQPPLPPPQSLVATFPYGTPNNEQTTYTTPVTPQALASRPAKQPPAVISGPPKPSPGFMAQLSARIAPNKPQTPPPQPQTQPQSHYAHQQHLPSQQLPPQQHQKSAQPTKEQMYQQYQQQQQQLYASNNGKNPIYAPPTTVHSHYYNQQQMQQQQQPQKPQQPPAHPPRQAPPKKPPPRQPPPPQPRKSVPLPSQHYGTDHGPSTTSHVHPPVPTQRHHPQPTQIQQQQHHLPGNSSFHKSNTNQNIYVSTNPFLSSPPPKSSSSSAGHYAPSTFGKDGHGSSASAAQNTNYQPTQGDKSILAKTSVGFIENLNARLAEQRLSGKAFAVRNFINSKAVPDPRVCHESLMDQIKRGSALKQNRTINDRSAPKLNRKVLSP